MWLTKITTSKTQEKNQIQFTILAMHQTESGPGASRDVCAVCGDQATKLRYSHYGATSWSITSTNSGTWKLVKPTELVKPVELAKPVEL